MSPNDRPDPVGAWVCDLHEQALAWVSEPPSASWNRTREYVDLYFAYCLARLGRSALAQERLERARAALVGRGPAHECLCAAFTQRVRQALAGEPLTGPIPADALAACGLSADESMLDPAAMWAELAGVTDPVQINKIASRIGSLIENRLDLYVVDRLRKHSSVLEPDQRINPYRHWGARISEFEKAIAELTDLTDRNEIAGRVEKLLREVPKGARGNEQKARVLRAGLESSPRVGEEFARKLLDQSIPAYDALPEARELSPLLEQAFFLEKILFVAGHYGFAEFVQAGLVRFQKVLRSTPDAVIFQVMEWLGKSCFRGLQKLQMHEEIEQTLRVMADVILKGRDLSSVDFGNEVQGPAALRSLLLVAGLWYSFGRTDQAEPTITVAHRVLFSNLLAPRDLTQLACAYVAAVGEGPLELARVRLDEVFRQLKGIKDTYTTSSHFSVSQLDVVESVVLAAIKVCA